MAKEVESFFLKESRPTIIRRRDAACPSGHRAREVIPSTEDEVDLLFERILPVSGANDLVGRK